MLVVVGPVGYLPGSVIYDLEPSDVWAAEAQTSLGPCHLQAGREGELGSTRNAFLRQLDSLTHRGR